MQNHDVLTRLNLRKTRTRVELIRFLSTHKHPFSAPELLAMLQRLHPSTNKTTVYRELETLSERGMVKEIIFGDRKVRYEFADLPHHHHLICRKCETVADVALENEFEAIEKNIAKTNRFVVEGHNLEFFGLCKKCS